MAGFRRLLGRARGLISKAGKKTAGFIRRLLGGVRGLISKAGKKTAGFIRRLLGGVRGLISSCKAKIISNKGLTKSITFYAVGIMFFLLSAWLVDVFFKIHFFMRPWLFKVLLCAFLLFLVNLAQKHWWKEKSSIIWGLGKFLFILAFAGWIIMSPDMKDLANWCIGQTSSSQVSKQWRSVLKRDLVGNGTEGDTAVFVAKFGSEIKFGDKIIMVAPTRKDFFITDAGRWVKCAGRYEIVSQCTGNGDFYLSAEKGMNITLEIQRFM